MRILNLPPVIDTGHGSKEMDDYIAKYLLPDTEMDTWYLDYGPSSIEGEYDEALAAANVVLKCIEGEKAGYDAVFVNCFGDPGVRAAREAVSIPVFGGFEPIAYYALGTADRIGIVTVLPEVVPLIEGEIARYGLEKRFTGVRCIDIPVHDSSCNCRKQKGHPRRRSRNDYSRMHRNGGSKRGSRKGAE